MESLNANSKGHFIAFWNIQFCKTVYQTVYWVGNMVNISKTNNLSDRLREKNNNRCLGCNSVDCPYSKLHV